MPPLENGRHELFALGLAEGKTADEAYEAAGYRANRGNAARLKANESVAARVAEIQRRAAEQTEASIAGVLAEFWSVAKADPNDLVELRRGCCRFCWGRKHRRQETQNERERRLNEWRRAALEAEKDEARQDPFPDFDELGGVGFNPKRAANPACPECFGDGVSEVFVKDTRSLPSAARALYAGVRVTKEGIEVRTHDKLGALTKVGQHLGMFTDPKKSKPGSEDEPFEMVVRWAREGEETRRDPSAADESEKS